MPSLDENECAEAELFSLLDAAMDVNIYRQKMVWEILLVALDLEDGG